jgi:hypothetical protein
MILDSVNAVLPKENQSAPGQTVRKQIITNGFSWDNRPLSHDDVKERYYNTKNHLLEKGIMVKVKIGHYQEYDPTQDNAQKLAGFVKSMELHQDSYENDFETSIWCELHVYPEVYKDYKDGRYPEVSIGDTGKYVIKDKNGNDVTKIIEHVAILGAERAANPHLKQMAKSFYSKLIAITNKNKKSITELKSMDIEKIKEMLQMLQDWAKAMLETLASSESSDGGDGGGEMSSKADNPDDEEKEEKSVSISESSKAFSKLVSDGCLCHDDRPDFDDLIEKTNDLDYAIKFFSKKRAKTPPNGEKTKSDRDETNIDSRMGEIRNLMVSMGVNPDDEKYKNVAEKSFTDLKEGGE